MSRWLWRQLFNFLVSGSGVPIHDGPKDQWDILNATVHGRLHEASPFARSCFPETSGDVYGRYDAGICTAVIAGYGDPAFRVNEFGSYMNTQWETCQATSDQCLLDYYNASNPAATTPPRVCAQGSVPKYYIDVHEPADVQAAFRFSRHTGVPLVVKNTGHDYSGRSSAPGSLALWISYDADFISAGCGADHRTQAVTFGAGVTQGTLYNFAEKNNLTLPGRAELTLGAAGGYLQGGGHGIFANAFGLAVDRALQFKVVTPTGAYLTASACQNTDLYFALRGGGGGTFGVVLEVTTLALPRIAFPAVLITLGDVDADLRSRWLKFMTSNAVRYAETGWGGFIAHTTGAIFANPFLNLTQAANEMATLQDFVTNVMMGTFTLSFHPSFLSFLNMYGTTLGTIPVGLPVSASSRLVTVDNFSTEEKRTELAETLDIVLPKSAAPLIFVVSPYYYKDDGLTSVTPAWRRSIWHIPLAGVWNFNTTKQEKQSILQGLSDAIDPLRAITPGSGAYQNEADVHEPDHTYSFWGKNYERLVEIKRKYDPHHLLDCWKCVDSRGPSDARFSCYI
ncbi:FAD-binding domain-containing protein [Cerioporus squamosus]|nr:FAD-binding domain-containing protein [Cerioporus squamosus]